MYLIRFLSKHYFSFFFVVIVDFDSLIDIDNAESVVTMIGKMSVLRSLCNKGFYVYQHYHAQIDHSFSNLQPSISCIGKDTYFICDHNDQQLIEILVTDNSLLKL